MRLIKGFFGGWVIAPERPFARDECWYPRICMPLLLLGLKAFCLALRDDAWFRCRNKYNAQRLGARDAAAGRPPPALHTLLFNAFLVLDHNLRVSTRPIAIEKVRSSPSTSTPDDDDDDSASYVDFGFGNTAPGSTFCGFHRFSLNNFNSESATGIHIAVRVLPTDLDSNQGPDADLNHVSEITRSARNGLRRV
jgi:hypothetical protein